MSNKNEPAFSGKYLTGDLTYNFTPGLTKREYAAIMAMQGLVISYGRAWTPQIAEQAIKIADALFEELNKK